MGKPHMCQSWYGLCKVLNWSLRGTEAKPIYVYLKEQLVVLFRFLLLFNKIYFCSKKEDNKIKKQGKNYGYNERPIRMWCTLRTPNKKMESKNEKVHFRC